MAFSIVQPIQPSAPIVLAPVAPLTRRTVTWLLRQGPAHLIMLVLALLAVVPLLWLVITAFAAPGAMVGGQLIAPSFSFENFAYVFEAIPMLQMLGNTVVMALTMSLAQLLVAILASYGFAIFDFPGRKVIYLLFVASWLVPFQVTMIPNYVLVSQLGLLNTVAGIVVPNLCSAFAVLMLRQHMRAIPRELIDASSMDGRSTWATLWLVIVPNLVPALASLAVILMISAWNEYTWPLLIMQQETSVMQVGIRSFMGAEGSNWGAIMAASGLACLPVFLLYIFLQRQIVAGFVRSGLK
ncbi:carbohydrate ABC transporter permease [Pseudarthrobacter sulfonivorans]|uniref:carbohydrate ABC transporter permease n=1 Tax=Pseudarthrobacter sulfonivorans TaxID=121292 RepID=UPI0028542A00|nr:carbohydrate ABC transporter permease [Pseudarthrobacter sulfonivorans]MDR6417486.1 ABC-type glycerol-3-phosphate transport system permease component [Pseudarthrobacter sulfonivorans]